MQKENAKSNLAPFFIKSTADHQFEKHNPLTRSHQTNQVIELLCSQQQDESTQLAIVNLAKNLDLYASIWERTPNLNQELRKTLWTIRDIDEYLYTAQLYLIQARHKHALQVLNAGMRHFSPDKPEYVLIKKLMQLAKRRLRICVDFITQSPYDILAMIVSHLDPETKSICANVSQSWRSRVLDCTEAWRVLELAGSSTKRKAKILGLLPAVAQHIETLTLCNDAKVNIKCIGLLCTRPFRNLQSLTIMDHSSFDFDMVQTLYSALPFIAQTLTELRIITPRSLEINLGTILTICENLYRIECRVYSIVDCTSSHIAVSHHTLLRCIDLQSTKFCINVSSLQPLLYHSRHLKTLTLGRCQEDILPVIGVLCPELTTIISNINKFKDIYNAVAPQLKQSDTSGLQCLSLDPIYSTEPIISRLAVSCNSLRAMYLAPSSDDDHGESVQDWEPLFSFTMHRLTHLSIDGSWSTAAFRTCLPGMLRCYPSLETLVLRNCFDQEEPPNTTEAGRDSIFNAMMDMDNLICLDMMYVRTGGQSLLRLLEHHAMSGSRLQKLSIVGGDGMVGDIVQHAARIKSLRELIIQNMRGLTTSDVTEFARQLCQLPHLSALSLAGMKLKIGAARNIAACKCLSSLTAFNLVITEEASLVLRNNIQNVKIF